MPLVLISIQTTLDSEDLRVDYVEDYVKYSVEYLILVLEGPSRNSLATVGLVTSFLT